jgi:hypothetical protein
MKSLSILMGFSTGVKPDGAGFSFEVFTVMQKRD